MWTLVGLSDCSFSLCWVYWLRVSYPQTLILIGQMIVNRTIDFESFPHVPDKPSEQRSRCWLLSWSFCVWVFPGCFHLIWPFKTLPLQVHATRICKFEMLNPWDKPFNPNPEKKWTDAPTSSFQSFGWILMVYIWWTSPNGLIYIIFRLVKIITIQPGLSIIIFYGCRIIIVINCMLVVTIVLLLLSIIIVVIIFQL